VTKDIAEGVALNAALFLELRDVSERFGGVTARAGVSFELRAGEVLRRGPVTAELRDAALTKENLMRAA
jgi:hypothetical protein